MTSNGSAEYTSPPERPAATRSILLVEDETVLRQSLAELLSQEGFEVQQASNGREGFDLLLDRPFDLVITDIRMPQMDGMELLGHLHKTAPQTPVIVITAYGTVDSAVVAMRAGAFDYVLKPLNFDDVVVKVERALEYGELSRTRAVLADQAAADSTFHNLIGDSAAMAGLFEMVRKLGAVKSTVLIVGESGTGKELFARAVHYNGVTRDKPFVAVNCGAIPDTLIESELFGYRRGAFTGANRDKIGYFEAAHHGTLFLDEISTLPLSVQSSLLRALEEHAVIPVGDTRPRPVDVRIVAATNRDLEEMVDEGAFREDLLYRLNVVKLSLPPLRRRKEDIPALVHHFLMKFTREMNKPVLGVSNAAMRALLAHEWRGNVRELENVVERSVIFAETDQVEASQLPFADVADDAEDGESLREAMRQFERQHILYCLRHHHYDKTETARHLKIGVSSLYRKLDELDIPKHLAERDPEG
ncbi:MAG: Fis family transcriptional regulator [Phycisphaeraceae bacterium]|nr:Fis family transcriptional regulator [Phycisphaeraceae bacterium]